MDFGRLGRLRCATQIKKIAAGSQHTIASDTWGRIYAWGSNEVSKTRPVWGHYSFITKVHVFNPSSRCNLSLRFTFVTFCTEHVQESTGKTTSSPSCLTVQYGQLGTGTTQDAKSPTIITALDKFAPIMFACGGDHDACTQLLL
jgi:alpha-tubulin suppressor-like RCC1 family protein